MTKFCIDLLLQQVRDGHQTALLWPGQMGMFRRKVEIKDRGITRLEPDWIGVHNYEVINPLPVSYDEGITKFDAYMKDGGREAYSELLETYQPDVVHVHTLMGIHRSFLEETKKRKIRLVFTAHDFFPICPKVTMFRQGAICSSVLSCNDCGKCNTTALSIKKICLLQSPFYREIKNSAFVRKLRKRHRDKYLSENAEDGREESVEDGENYKKLRAFYDSYLQLMDMVHYNSTITKAVYESVFMLPNSCVIGITHGDMSDHRRRRDYSRTGLRIRYLGPLGGAKGFFC